MNKQKAKRIRALALPWLWLMFIAMMAGLALSIYGKQTADAIEQTIESMPRTVQVTGTSLVPIEQPSEQTPEQTTKGSIATIGAFSDRECGSAWCNRHEPKDNQIALNYRKYGQAKEVYIPAFDKTYRVVGNTYSENGNHLDAEIWFGNDRQAALNFGIKQLRIVIIK